jgi:hypothetical protein
LNKLATLAGFLLDWLGFQLSGLLVVDDLAITMYQGRHHTRLAHSYVVRWSL